MKVLKGSQGIAMVVVIAMMVILLSITGAALLFSGLNLKAASNLKTGSGAIHAADAGVQHALAIIPNGTNFTYSSSGTSVVPTTAFPTPTSSYNYTVTATNNPPSTLPSTSTAILTSTANGPNNSRRVIRAYIGRSTTSWTPPGAIFIPGSTASQEVFDPSSTTWTVTGNDTNYNNTSGPQPAIPGIATTNAAVTSSILTSLGTDARKQRVTGAGYSAGPPVTPSVQTTTRTDDVNAMAQSFINQMTATTCPPKCLTGYNTSLGSCPAASPCTLGTDLAPQITYITGSSTVSLGGYVNGSGVLVVNANEVVLLDNFNFHGLVFHIQSTQIGPQLELTIKGNAQVYGGLMLGPNASQLEIEVDNTAAIRYSSQAINMVNTWWGSCCIPGPAKLIAWNEVMQ